MSEDKELTCGQFRFAGGDVTHGWWLLWYQWELAAGIFHEPKTPCWPAKWAFSVQVGPLSWHITWEGDR